MTSKLTITRERMQEIAEDGFLKHGESKELARIALAAMDSEPVAISHDTREFLIESMNDSLGQDSPTELDYQFAADIEKLLQSLYRHAKPTTMEPAPVVPQDVLYALQKVARIRLDLNDFDGDCRGIADCLDDAEEALIEVVNRRAAMLAAAPQEVNP